MSPRPRRTATRTVVPYERKLKTHTSVLRTVVASARPPSGIRPEMADDGGVGEHVHGLDQQRAERRDGDREDPPIEPVEAPHPHTLIERR